MIHHTRRTAALLAAAAISCTAAALAAPAPMGSTSAMPAVSHQGNVSYVSGGIGQDEEMAMKAAEKRYPLTLEFIARDKPHPDYLADVPVTIRDHAGHTVLDTVSKGPYLLAQLQPGKYTVTARENGVTRTDHVTLAEHQHEKVVFEWSH